MQTGQPGIVVEAGELAETIRHASRRSSFEGAVRDFRRLMRTVPDYAVGEISTSAIAALTETAERVIDCIETRLDTCDDPPATQLELARSVYSIRRALERIDRWRRHYAPAS
jgi:hypothetical protein